MSEETHHLDIPISEVILSKELDARIVLEELMMIFPDLKDMPQGTILTESIPKAYLSPYNVQLPHPRLLVLAEREPEITLMDIFHGLLYTCQPVLVAHQKTTGNYVYIFYHPAMQEKGETKARSLSHVHASESMRQKANARIYPGPPASYGEPATYRKHNFFA